LQLKKTVKLFVFYLGMQLPEGGDFAALYCQPSTNFDRSTKLDLTTEPPLLGSTHVKAVSGVPLKIM
jgi:hypothetical protein